jgi:signal transduction histidine kinase
VIESLRASRWYQGFAHVSGPRWRLLAGLALLLAALAQTAANVHDAARLGPVAVLGLVMAVAWALQLGRWGEHCVWLLGGASCALMLVAPGTAAVIGVFTALVIVGMRVSMRGRSIAALAIAAAFLLVDFSQAQSTTGSYVGTAFTAAGLAFAYLGAISVRRVRQERERAEALLAELQRTRSAEIERAALTERARIAREIHDVLAHTLSSLAVQLEGTRLLLEQRPGDPAAVAAVERAHRLATEGLSEARRAISALRGDQLPGPDGLQRLVDEFGAATGTPSCYEVTGQPTPLGAEAQLALYRTAQEALTNVRKHAPQASSVEVHLSYADDGAELLVEDEAPPETDGSSGGYGLVGMRERAELVGGTLEAGPLPTGFRVRLWLPRA